MSLDLTVQSYTDDTRLEQDCLVTEATLSDAMCKQPGLLSYYGNQHTEASRQLSRIKRIFDVGEARLYDKAVEHFASLGDEKVTEGKIKSWIRKQTTYSKLCQLLDDAIFEEARAKVAYEAIKERRRMLNDFGNYRRDEMRSSVSVAVHGNTVAEQSDRRARFQAARQRLNNTDGNGDE